VQKPVIKVEIHGKFTEELARDVLAVTLRIWQRIQREHPELLIKEAK
jgi:hypothetical protein